MMSNSVNVQKTNDEWSCTACTHINPSQLQVCKLCGKGTNPKTDDHDNEMHNDVNNTNFFTCDELIRWITYMDVISNDDRKEKDKKQDLYPVDNNSAGLDPLMLVHNGYMNSTTLLESIINVFWDPYNEHGNTNDVNHNKDGQNFEKKFRSSIIRWLKHWMIYYWTDDFVYSNNLPKIENNQHRRDRQSLLDRLNKFIDQLKNDNSVKPPHEIIGNINGSYLIELGQDLANIQLMMNKEHNYNDHEMKKTKYDRWVWGGNDFKWKHEKIIWIGFYSNDENKLVVKKGNKTKMKISLGKIKKSKCYFAELPKDMIKHILSFAKGRIYFESSNMLVIKMKIINNITIGGLHAQLQPNYQLLNQLLEPDWNSIDIKRFNIKDSSIDIVDIAKQLTLITYRIFMNVSPKEYINKRWFHQDEIGAIIYSPYLTKTTKFFQHLVTFIQLKIIGEKTLKKRIKSMKETIRLCQELEKLGNFHALVAVFGAATQSAPVWKLKDGWNKVFEKAKYKQEKDRLARLMDTHHSQRNLRTAMRERLNDSNGGFIPYSGVYLSDLIFIEDGNRNMIDIENVRSINFAKWYRIYDRINVICSIVQSNIKKNAYFDIEPKWALQKALLQELELTERMSEEDIWNLSDEARVNDKNENEKSSNKLKFFPFVQN